MDSTGNGVQSALEQLQAAHERCCRQIERQLEAAQRAVTEHHQRLRQRCDQLHRQKRDLVWDVGERCHTDKARLEQALRSVDRRQITGGREGQMWSGLRGSCKLHSGRR